VLYRFVNIQGAKRAGQLSTNEPGAAITSMNADLQPANYKRMYAPSGCMYQYQYHINDVIVSQPTTVDAFWVSATMSS